MDNESRIARMKEDDYQKIFGVKSETFQVMLEVLEAKFKEEHKRGGHPPKLSVLDKLVMMLSYYREYRTMENIAFDYGVAKSTVSESVRWAESTLLGSGRFKVPSKRRLFDCGTRIETVIVDATECEIERPKKNRGCSTRARRSDTR